MPEPAPKRVLVTVCEALTVYVPAPPEPVPNAVMVVAKATPVPLMVMPTARVPEEMAVTVSVVVEMAPVKDAARLKVPWAQRTQKFWPAAENEPAGHCVHLPAKAESKKWPLWQFGCPERTTAFGEGPSCHVVLPVGEPRKKHRFPLGFDAEEGGAINVTVDSVVVRAGVAPAAPLNHAWPQVTAGVVSVGAPEKRVAGAAGAPEKTAVYAENVGEPVEDLPFTVARARARARARPATHSAAELVCDGNAGLGNGAIREAHRVGTRATRARGDDGV